MKQAKTLPTTANRKVPIKEIPKNQLQHVIYNTKSSIIKFTKILIFFPQSNEKKYIK